MQVCTEARAERKGRVAVLQVGQSGRQIDRRSGQKPDGQLLSQGQSHSTALCDHQAGMSHFAQAPFPIVRPQVIQCPNHPWCDVLARNGGRVAIAALLATHSCLLGHAKAESNAATRTKASDPVIPSAMRPAKGAKPSRVMVKIAAGRPFAAQALRIASIASARGSDRPAA